MIYNIQRFILFILISLIFLLYSLFSYYFIKQEEEIASVILKSLNNNISEISYTLSKNIEKKEDVLSYRALLDRISSNQDFIKAILIFDDKKILMTTNPNYTTIDENSDDPKQLDTAYKKLMYSKYIKYDINFYEGNIRKTLQLVYILEQEEIYSHLIKNKLDFIFYFGFMPIIALIFLIIILRIYISKPLELLRQYAYYNNIVPKPFKIRELESIRHSMVDSFTRLEKEKNELYHMARTDSLSGLSNRNSLNEFLQRLIPAAKRRNEEFAFLFLDLDHFKMVNDSLGHNVGDELLQNVASLIKKTLRTDDFVARIGGDEFVIIIQDYKSYIELTQIIERIQEYLAKTWIIQTHSLSIACSIGVAFYPKDGEDTINLMKNADIAMYEAKKLGRNQYHFFSEKLNTKVQEGIALNKDMKQALVDKEYMLYYQPKIDLNTSEIIGCEALIRWISPSKGFIPPSKFIPLAEENNFIKELGFWIIDEAFEQLIKWQKIGIDIPISINISAKQLLEDNFISIFLDKLKLKNIDPKKIDLEITEYIFIEQTKRVDLILNELHNIGITISLDDFGTGYSSLSYLKKFPIDYLKIDKTFLDDFNSLDGSIFLETIVKLGQMLKIKVIAEGVETKEQVEYLTSISCDQYQGYYFSKPLNVKDFEKLYFKSNS